MTILDPWPAWSGVCVLCVFAVDMLDICVWMWYDKVMKMLGWLRGMLI